MAGATLLARGQAQAMLFFENTAATAAFSFRAAAICLPIFLLMQGSFSLGTRAGDTALVIFVDMLVFACAWAGFALASLMLANFLGAGGRWPRFIAAWNWCAVVQYGALLAFSLPGWVMGTGLLLDMGGLVAFGYALWLEWFVARIALGLTGFGASIFILLDVALALFLGSIASRILGA